MHGLDQRGAGPAHRVEHQIARRGVGTDRVRGQVRQHLARDDWTSPHVPAPPLIAGGCWQVSHTEVTGIGSAIGSPDLCRAAGQDQHVGVDVELALVPRRGGRSAATTCCRYDNPARFAATTTSTGTATSPCGSSTATQPPGTRLARHRLEELDRGGVVDRPTGDDQRRRLTTPTDLPGRLQVAAAVGSDDRASQLRPRRSGR